MVLCVCGKDATYHCTGCTPSVQICLSCIPGHLAQNNDDCIKPIKLRQTGSNICESCGTEKAVKLGVFDNCAKKLCKLCKGAAELCIDLKWSNFVHRYSDLDQLSIRKAALSRLHRELDQFSGSSTVLSEINSFKQDVLNLVEESFSKKIKEISGCLTKHDTWLGKVRKEANEQSFKKEIDTSTDGGRLLQGLLQSNSIDFKKVLPLVLYPEIQEFRKFFHDFIENLKLADKKNNEKAVYLFSPGKNVLFKITLGQLKKHEMVFEKNWNFEASWIQIESGELFFCGGNGRDNSEVLLVSLNTKVIRNLQSFTGRSGHTLVQVDRDIFVFGGNKGNFTEKYQLGIDCWTVLAAIPNKIPRACSALTMRGVVVTGAETEKFFLYDLQDNTYSTLDFQLTGYNLKNKIIFLYEDSLICLSGDKIIVQKWSATGELIQVVEHQAIDRDWWSYSAPVIHNKCAYFIKYFVRNLWCLNLETFKLTEISLSTLS